MIAICEPESGVSLDTEFAIAFDLDLAARTMGSKCLLLKPPSLCRTSLVAQRVKHLSTMQETWVWSLGWEIPWRRKWQSTPVLLAGRSHGQRSLVGYSLWGHKSRTWLSDFTSQSMLCCYSSWNGLKQFSCMIIPHFLSIHWFVNFWIVPILWLLWIIQLWAFVHRFICGHMFSLLFDVCLGLEL